MDGNYVNNHNFRDLDGLYEDDDLSDEDIFLGHIPQYFYKKDKQNLILSSSNTKMGNKNCNDVNKIDNKFVKTVNENRKNSGKYHNLELPKNLEELDNLLFGYANGKSLEENLKKQSVSKDNDIFIIKKNQNANYSFNNSEIVSSNIKQKNTNIEYHNDSNFSSSKLISEFNQNNPRDINKFKPRKYIEYNFIEELNHGQAEIVNHPIFLNKNQDTKENDSKLNSIINNKKILFQVTDKVNIDNIFTKNDINIQYNENDIISLERNIEKKNENIIKKNAVHVDDCNNRDTSINEKNNNNNYIISDKFNGEKKNRTVSCNLETLKNITLNKNAKPYFKTSNNFEQSGKKEIQS